MAITYRGIAVNPADTGSNSTSPVSVTPVAGCVEGDLVVLIAAKRGAATMNLSMSETSGQTWVDAGEHDGSNFANHGVFYCRFNGTWGSDPSIAHSAGGSDQFGVTMLVFVPTDADGSWAVDNAFASTDYSAPSTPFTVTRTGVTTTQPNCVAIATFVSEDNNTWDSLTGSGWSSPGATVYTRQSTDFCRAHAYKIQASAGATGNVSLNQATLGGDAGATSIISFYEVAYSSPWAYVNSTSNTVVGGSTIITLTKPSGTADGDLLVAEIATSSNTTFTPPSGWQSINSINDSGTTTTIGKWWKIASSEGASWDWTFGATKAAGGVIAYTPPSGTTPALQTNTTTTTSAGTAQVDATGITTTHEDSLIVGAFAAADTGTLKTFTAVGSQTERVDTGIGSTASVAIEMSTGVKGNPGATGTRSALANSAFDQIGLAILSVFYGDTGGGTTNDPLFYGAPF